MKIYEIWDFKDYKSYLRKLASSETGAVSKMAQIAGCQRSYLSRVINGEVHLTPDHAFALTEQWQESGQLDDSGAEYFTALVELERASTPKLREHLKNKADLLRRRSEKLENVVERTSVTNQIDMAPYYSAWYWSAIHILTSLPHCQTPEKISRALGLPLAVVESCLTDLSKNGLVRQERQRWQYSGAEPHIPKESPLASLHHGNWRSRAVMDAQVPRAESVHYTVVQSMSEAAYEQIRKKLLHFIRDSARTAGPSKEEILVCMTSDLYRVDQV